MRLRVFFLVALPAFAGALGACGSGRQDDTTSASSSELRALEPQEAIGSLTYGQTSAPVTYTCPPRFRAFSFQGKAGDTVDVTVHATAGHPVAWLTTSAFADLVSDANAAGAADAHLKTTLSADGTYYVAFRDRDLTPGTFAVTLQGHAACNPDEDPNCTCEECGTGTPDAGQVTTDDPFDPASCTGPMATLSDFAGRFNFGQKWLDLGSYHIAAIYQQCEPIGGCSPWMNATNDQSLLSFRTGPWDAADLDGTLALENDGDSLTIWLRHHAGPTGETVCTTSSTTGAACSRLETDGLHSPWGGQRNDRVACSFYQNQPNCLALGSDLQVFHQAVAFEGVLTTHCARFEYQFKGDPTTVKLATLVRF